MKDEVYTIEEIEESGAKGGLSRYGRNALLLLRDMAICILVIILVLQLISPTIVYEHSMENTLHPRDYVFLAKQAYAFSKTPEHGDIIVFESALKDESGANKKLIKRVIAVPGDSVSIHGGFVWLNGEAIDEPYTKDGETIGYMEEITIPDDGYFVLGDNRRISKDSRYPDVGLVSEADITGKVIFRLLPLSSAGKV